MKRSLKFLILTIPNKLRVDVKVITDDTNVSEYISSGRDVCSLTLYPLVSISIVRGFEIDENGVRVRPPWNPNDSLPLTKYNVGIFLKELKDINSDMKIKELYNYFNNRLELNEDLGEKITKKFKVGNNSVEFAPVVISLLDDNRVEGIKLKINNEESTVLLTLNDIEALIYCLDHLNADLIAFMLFNRYTKGTINVRNSEGDRSDLLSK